MKSSFVIVAASLALAACGSRSDPAHRDNAGSAPVAAATASPGAVTVATARRDPLGVYLVDSQGRALYISNNDTQGHQGTPPATTCTGRCTQTWIPLIVEGTPTAGGDAKASLLSSFARPDGKMQAAYAGRPLYRYHADRQTGDTRGQDARDTWGGWYLVAPSGDKIGTEPPESVPAQ
jgi:predicted lipoprotein with Yx(FWY)xxD motif